MRKHVAKLYIVLLVLGLFLPAPLYYAMKAHLDSQSRENKAIGPFPVPTAENYAEYPRKIEGWLGGILPFKNQIATIDGIMDYYVIGETRSTDVVIGRDGWLFYTGRQDAVEDPISDFLGTDLFTEEELTLATSNLLAARDYMEQHGGRFLLVLSPSKMSIYPEMLPERYGKPAEYKRLQQLADHLRDNTDLEVVRCYEELQAYKQAFPEDRIFLKYDTHETYVGSYVSADAILRVLGQPPLPELHSLTWQPNENGEADLANILGIKKLVHDDFNCWNVAFHRHYIDDWMNETETELRFANTEGNGTPEKLMLVSDSFGEGMIPFLADYYNESYMVYPGTYTPEILEREQPDILIYQVTERLLPNLLKFVVE
ncbi:MAG: hypothetical protein K6E50_04495 [Lachnospiraceae bacterium]|nr:hypothetical protein [Lachnospiraceae bacterium]